MIADIRLMPVTGLPEIGLGDDLGRLIADAAAEQGTLIRAGDVVVVTQKIVSKAEGRLVRLSEVEPSPFARGITPPDRDPRQVEVVLRERRRSWSAASSTACRCRSAAATRTSRAKAAAASWCGSRRRTCFANSGFPWTYVGVGGCHPERGEGSATRRRTTAGSWIPRCARDD